MTASTVNRMVHYMARGSADGVYPSVCRAAIVTEVGDVIPGERVGVARDQPDRRVLHVTVCLGRPVIRGDRAYVSLVCDNPVHRDNPHHVCHDCDAAWDHHVLAAVSEGCCPIHAGCRLTPTEPCDHYDGPQASGVCGGWRWTIGETDRGVSWWCQDQPDMPPLRIQWDTLPDEWHIDLRRIIDQMTEQATLTPGHPSH